MKKMTWITGLTLLVAATAAGAHEPGAHVHGVGELRIAVDGPELVIDLESPLDNLLGFEHAPRTDRERAAVRAMAAKLRQSQTMFAATAAARCTSTKVELGSSALPPELLGEPPAATAAPDPDGHADLDASFAFRCEVPERLQGIDVGLLQAFPGFRRLNVSVAGPKSQSAVVLTPPQRAVRW